MRKPNISEKTFNEMVEQSMPLKNEGSIEVSMTTVEEYIELVLETLQERNKDLLWTKLYFPEDDGDHVLLGNWLREALTTLETKVRADERQKVLEGFAEYCHEHYLGCSQNKSSKTDFEYAYDNEVVCLIEPFLAKLNQLKGSDE